MRGDSPVGRYRMTVSQADIDRLTGGESTPAPDPETPAAPVDPRPIDPRNMRSVLNLTVPVTVSLAERHMAVSAILAIRVGTIVEFDVPVDTDLTLEVAGRSIGKGHAVKIGEHFGLRILKIDPVQARIGAMGPSSSA